jgi:hypothetical protein
MGYVWKHLDGAGQCAVLALLDAGKLTMAVLTPASDARVAIAREEDSELTVPDGTTVEMFLEYLRMHRGYVVISRLAARLVPGDEVALPC